MIEPKSVLTGKIFSGEPVVSVCVITYNHGKYIRQCLDGILMQEVTFPYEILIHDDASPDNTAEIIREYEAKYPEIIKPIYQTVNQYSQGIDVGKYIFERAVGKYIALCDGDDYWTDPKKLQIQVDFLEKHPEYVGTAHKSMTVNASSIPIKGLADAWITEKTSLDFTLNDIVHYRLPGSTASLVFRNIFKKLEIPTQKDYYNLPGSGDQKLSVILLMSGKIYRFSKIMSAYRYVTTNSTSWTASNQGKNLYGENYRYSIAVNSFCMNKFKVDINTYALSIGLIISSIHRYIRHPSKDNREVLYTIYYLSKLERKYTQNMLKKLILCPFETTKIITRIWKERKEISMMLSQKNRDFD